MISGYRFRLLGYIGILLSTVLCTAGEEIWTEVTSPNFVVLSNASQKQARRTARTLEQFRSLIQTCMPRWKVDPGSPLVVFAARDGGSLKDLLPAEGQKKGMAQPAGLFQAGSERNFVLLRIDVPGDQGYHIIYHEYVHMLQRLNFQNLPLWLAEGLAEFFGHSTISDSSSSLGNISAEQIEVLRNSQLIPLDALLAAGHDSPLYRQEEMSQIFYAQSWALIHYLMIGDKQAHSGQLSAFLNLIHKGVSEQEAAGRAFGDLKLLEKNLENYVRAMAFYHYSIPAKLAIKEDQYAARALSPAELLVARGDLFVHTNRLPEAKAALELALNLDSRSARANEAMGLLYLRLQNQAQAQKFFSAAAELDSKSFMAQFYAAKLAYESGEEGDMASAESHLRKTLAINPQFAPAYRMLSQVLMTQKEKLPEALELAKKAADLEPAELSHQLNVGRVLMAMEKLDEAYNHGQRVLAAARTEGDRSQAELFLSWVKNSQEAALRAKRYAEAQREQARKMEEQRQLDEAAAKQAKAAAPVLPIKTGPAAKARGVVRSIKCDYPAIMDLVLEAGGKRQMLRAENYYQVQYWAVGNPGRGNFQPCDELEGKRVEIEYVTVKDQNYSGLIKTIVIEK